MKCLVLVCAVLLAGCAGRVDEQPAAPTIDMSKYGPRHDVPGYTPRPADIDVKPPSDAVARELASGAVGVLDLTGTIAVRPSVLETSSDGSLEKLDWSRWTASGAEGAGEFRILDCQPSCATGHTRRVAATVRLSDVETCDGRRYFGKAAVVLAEGPPPTASVRAPC